MRTGRRTVAMHCILQVLEGKRFDYHIGTEQNSVLQARNE